MTTIQHASTESGSSCHQPGKVAGTTACGRQVDGVHDPRQGCRTCRTCVSTRGVCPECGGHAPLRYGVVLRHRERVMSPMGERPGDLYCSGEGMSAVPAEAVAL